MALTDRDAGRVAGHVSILLVRLDALKEALDEQPGRTPEVEFQYDRVLRATTKLAALFTEETTTTEREGR